MNNGDCLFNKLKTYVICFNVIFYFTHSILKLDELFIILDFTLGIVPIFCLRLHEVYEAYKIE